MWPDLKWEQEGLSFLITRKSSVSARPLRLVEVDNVMSEDQSTSSVEHIGEVPDNHMHWLLVSPQAPLPNGDVDNKFEGPMKGRFKVIKVNVTQREQEHLLQKGWGADVRGTWGCRRTRSSEAARRSDSWRSCSHYVGTA